MNGRRTSLLLAGFAVALACAWYTAGHPMDFRVYHYGANGVFDGTRPVYGETSGLGWPMHYRYPPLFLLLFAPFAALPLGISAGVWVILKLLFLYFLIRLIKASEPSSHPRSYASFLVPFFIAGPYVVQELRYGNAQFFVFALSAVALLVSRKRPALAAGSLALAIAIKVWPLFFVPYLGVRREWRVVSWTLVIVAALTLLPAVYFGFDGNLALLSQWFDQEFGIQTGANEIWFPSQSLRGVMMRYLTEIDYSTVPDSNYRLVHFATMDPVLVRTLWAAGAVLLYAAFLGIAYAHRDAGGWFVHAAAFALLPLLQPFTQKYALVVLLWPAMAAGTLMKHRSLAALVCFAIAVVWIQILAPGSANQRLLQVLGLDFVVTLVLFLVLIADPNRRSSEPGGHRPPLQVNGGS